MSYVLLAALTIASLAEPSDTTPKVLPPFQCLDRSGVVLPDAAAPYKVGGDVQAPQVVQRVAPDFSHLGKSAIGAVIIETIIDRQGKVCAARIIKSPSVPYGEANLGAVLQWRFKPAMLNGAPVPVYFVLTSMPHPQ